MYQLYTFLVLQKSASKYFVMVMGFLGILFLLPVEGYTQSGKISGTVVDDNTGEPLPGVNVVIEETDKGASTNGDGNYTILNVRPGSYTVRASYIGYQTLRKTDVEVNINRTTNINFELTETGIEEEEVVVSAVRKDVEPDQSSTVDIVDPEEMSGTPGFTDLSAVIDLQAEVNDGHFRGGRSGEEQYRVSGMGIVNPLNSSRTFSPLLSAVEEVEVITSGFSAEYGNAMSGVVNISMKEGPRDWQGEVRYQTRLPTYKHWGGSVYGTENNPYIDRLNSVQKWRAPDPDNPNRELWEGSIGRGLGSSVRDGEVGYHFAVDPEERGPTLVYNLWQQAHRDIGQEYDDSWDQLFNITLGGPLGDDVRMFAAMQRDIVWPFLPTPEPNATTRIMGNLVFDVGKGKKLKLLGNYAKGFQQEFSSSTGGFYRWQFDRVIGANKVDDRTISLGLDWSHMLGEKTFYELQLNTLSTEMKEGVDVLAQGRFRDDIYERSAWERTYWPDGFRTGIPGDDFYNEKSMTTSFTGSISSQVTHNHQIKAGIQANFYSIDVQNQLDHGSESSAEIEFYESSPYEAAIYAQDKMEFQGMVANVGLRLDGYDPNNEYYVNEFSPFTDPENPGSVDREKAETRDAPRVVRLSPRLGFSFPVSEDAVFHLNYGSYLQRPDLQYLVGRRTTLFNENLGTSEAVRLGNPRLKPEETQSYDMGVVLGLGPGLTLDLSGYYKDVKNLTQRVIFRDSNGRQYETLANRDYADIRGANIKLNKRRGFLRGSIRYHYSVATGKASTPFNASPIFDERGIETRLPPPRDIFLDYDRRHSLVVNLRVLTPNDWGPALGTTHPLEQMQISFLHTTKSGRPYTGFSNFNDPQAPRNNQRSPWEYNTDVRMTKDVTIVENMQAELFFEIFNLFNRKTFDYWEVFNDAENLQKWAQQPENIHLHTNDNGFTADQTFRIYENAPRSFNLGFKLKFN